MSPNTQISPGLASRCSTCCPYVLKLCEDAGSRGGRWPARFKHHDSVAAHQGVQSPGNGVLPYPMSWKNRTINGLANFFHRSLNISPVVPTSVMLESTCIIWKW